jgi:hypothetical protein
MSIFFGGGSLVLVRSLELLFGTGYGGLVGTFRPQ